MKKRAPERDPIKTTAEYYRLHPDAVNALAEADESNSPPVSEKELAKYKSGGRLRIPEWIKIPFIKFWFSAAVCFFFMWGLGTMDMLDTLVILSLASGLITDLLTNTVLRFIAPKKGAYDKWMMYPGEKVWFTLVPNILHAGVIIFLVYRTYNMINSFIIAANSLPADTVVLGVEPILFGIFYLIFDLILIRLRRLLCDIVSDAKKAAGKGR